MFGSLIKRVNPFDEKVSEVLENLMIVIIDPLLFEKLADNSEVSCIIQRPKFIAFAADKEIRIALQASKFFQASR